MQGEFLSRPRYRITEMVGHWLTKYRCTDLWLSFAINPLADPSSGDISWPKYLGADSKTLVHLATDSQIVQFRLGSTVTNLCA